MIIIRAARAAIVALLAGMMMAGGGTAQETGECRLAPLELPLFGGTPVAELATPPPDATPPSAHLSQSQAEEVLEQYVSCTNTSDPALAWAVFSPRWFSETFADPEEHYLPAFEWMIDTTGGSPAIPLELVEVVAVEPRDDHRVDVTATFRSGDQEWTDRLTLAPVHGQWLVDEVELDVPGS